MTSNVVAYAAQLLGKARIEICGRFNASVARSLDTLLPTIQRNLATTARSHAILSKNVLLIPRTVKLMLIRIQLVLLLLLVLLQLETNLFLL
jgi:hypothetical protein